MANLPYWCALMNLFLAMMMRCHFSETIINDQTHNNDTQTITFLLFIYVSNSVWTALSTTDNCKVIYVKTTQRASHLNSMCTNFSTT